ncbi:MAG: pseudouridine synthase [Acidimicrobiales bacterium]
MSVRLDRLLANNGLGSRSEVRSLLRSGRVTVDGTEVRHGEVLLDERESRMVEVDGAALEFLDGLLLALHKPVGVVCSHAGAEGPPVYGLLPERWMARRPRPEAIGRLDRDSSGLLLVTDRHELVHRLGAPGREVPKRYVVTLSRPVTDPAAIIAVFGAGSLVLDGAPCRPAQVAGDPTDPTRFEVVLTEGRHRQVRRMFSACGHDVVALHRTAVGPYELGGLEPGKWRIESSPA